MIKSLRKLLVISFCLFSCVLVIGTSTEAAKIEILPLDRSWRPKSDVDFHSEKEREDNDVYAIVQISITDAGISSSSTPKVMPKVTVSLSEVTNWKGICGNGNDPDASSFADDPPNPDLVLEVDIDRNLNTDWQRNYDLNGNYDGTLTYTLKQTDDSDGSSSDDEIDSVISVKVSCKD